MKGLSSTSRVCQGCVPCVPYPPFRPFSWCPRSASCCCSPLHTVPRGFMEAGCSWSHWGSLIHAHQWLLPRTILRRSPWCLGLLDLHSSVSWQLLLGFAFIPNSSAEACDVGFVWLLCLTNFWFLLLKKWTLISRGHFAWLSVLKSLPLFSQEWPRKSFEALLPPQEKVRPYHPPYFIQGSYFWVPRPWPSAPRKMSS